MSLNTLRTIKESTLSHSDVVDNLLHHPTYSYYVAQKQQQFIRKQQELPEICREHCEYLRGMEGIEQEVFHNSHPYSTCIEQCKKDIISTINK